MRPARRGLLLSLVGVAIAVAVAVFVGRSEAKVAEVGALTISAEQLRQRQAHVEVLYPGEGSAVAALAQLIKGYLAAAILARHGMPLDRQSLNLEAARIDQQTRDATTLARIKAAYPERDDFLWVGILPDYAQSRLQQWYAGTPSFAEPARQRAMAFLDQAEQQPQSFVRLAREAGATVRALRVSRDGVAPLDAEKSMPHQQNGPASTRQMAVALLAKLQGLSPGSIYANTLETPNAYAAVRLVQRLDVDIVTVELASFAKPELEDWFWVEASSVAVKIYDSTLAEGLRTRVGWTSRLFNSVR